MFSLQSCRQKPKRVYYAKYARFSEVGKGCSARGFSLPQVGAGLLPEIGALTQRLVGLSCTVLDWCGGPWSILSRKFKKRCFYRSPAGKTEKGAFFPLG